MGRVFAGAHIFQNPYKRWAGVAAASNPSAQETDVVVSWAIDRLCLSGEAPLRSGEQLKKAPSMNSWDTHAHKY